jgi:hypothetical protein
MAVDLGELVDSLRREISPPGTDLYPDAEEDELVGHLQDAFWEARLHGLFVGYQEADGLVTPISGTTEFPRQLQQAVVLYAGYRILLASLQNVSTSFSAAAGPVKFEQGKSAQTLRDVLAAVRDRIKLVLTNLSSYGGSDTTVLDAVIERSFAQAYGDTWFVK